MTRFNLDDYETVEARHARAITAYPDLRCVLVNHTTPTDRAASTWVVEARVYLNAGDQATDLPKATEWAFEVDGTGGANTTSALENAATSALGRALRWALAGSKGPSATEMAKVQRGAPQTVAPAAVPDEFVTMVDAAVSFEELDALWNTAVKKGYSVTLQPMFTKRKKALTND
jgi:hypothetical protein